MEKRFVDIVIPVIKPDEEFKTLLDKLAGQKLAPGRIIIMCTDETDSCTNTNIESIVNSSLAKDIAQIHHLPKAEFNHGMTRNRALEFSDAKYFICMTQDAVPADDMLTEKLIGAMSETIRMTYARQLARSDANEIEKITREFNYPDKGCIKSEKDKAVMGIKTYYASNVCAAYDREIFDSLGGFVETVFNEDMIYAGRLLKAGYSLAYVPEAKVIHSHNFTGAEQFRRNREVAKSQSLHPEVFGDIKSESEGIKLVKTTAVILIKRGRIYLIPKLIWQSACKYLGYKSGKKETQNG